jgi:hypothetical protein
LPWQEAPPGLLLASSVDITSWLKCSAVGLQSCSTPACQADQSECLYLPHAAINWQGASWSCLLAPWHCCAGSSYAMLVRKCLPFCCLTHCWHAWHGSC